MQRGAARPSAGSGSIRRFARGQSALLHKQPDDVWRLDFQLGWNIDPRGRARAGAHRARRVRAMLGARRRASSSSGSSIYTFQCRRLERFVHDRVIFAGDARAPRVTVRRTRRERRHPGRRQPRAGSSRSCCGSRARGAARQLRRRARPGGRREHPSLDAQHRVHHAESRPSAARFATRCSTLAREHRFARA